MKRQIDTPIDDDVIRTLHAGDMVTLTGFIYTARDAAHKRMYENNENPFDFAGAAVYYAGPSPAPQGGVIGSIGPTTSGRMDKYSPEMIRRGLKIMIGKGERNDSVVAAIKEGCGVYFAAIGGAAALLSKRVVSAEVVAYDDLGTEAVRKLYVRDFPVIVSVDSFGNTI
ncbi:fumarate hydratase [Clostridia bacterium]|nr:fumarate hydratase [Clostridia bacterium]